MVATTAPSRTGAKLAGILLAGCAVAVALGVYARVHHPAARPLFLVGFSGMLQIKTWLATLALVLVVVQVCTASVDVARLPGAAPRRPGSARCTGGAAAWRSSRWSRWRCTASGRWDSSPLSSRARAQHRRLRVLRRLHREDVGLRVRGLPGWTLPVLGGLVFALFVLAWLTSALWFFTRSGLPLT